MAAQSAPLPIPPPALPTPGTGLSFDTHPLFGNVLDTLSKIENTGLPAPLHKPTLFHLINKERLNSVQHNEGADAEPLNDFMTCYLEALQIQKMELERIFKLCDDFCTRYLAILKSPNDADLVNKAGTGLGSNGYPSPAPSPGALSPTPTGAAGPVALKRKAPDSPSMLAAHEYMNSRKKRRGNLPKAATNLLKKWLFEHLFHPYPTEEEKQALSSQTGLSLNQISNWFINARRRILQPMLETVRQQQALHTFDQTGAPPMAPAGPLPFPSPDQQAAAKKDPKIEEGSLDKDEVKANKN